MRRTTIRAVALASTLALLPARAFGQHGHDPKLHVDTRWKECSFHLHSSLTQEAWHQFAAEAGLVVYFRPLTDARPMGAGRWEVSALQWGTAIDDADPAWNDTFVHPDSTHWLFDGSRLNIPGLMVRHGLTSRIDVGAYFTKSPGANYGFFGAQAQYQVVRDPKGNWDGAARLSVVSLYGPDDLDFMVVGMDLLASREIRLRWLSLSPYAGVSSYLANAHETSAAVDLADERVLGVQAMIGAAVRISVVRIGVEYSTARVGSRSLKVGVAF